MKKLLKAFACLPLTLPCDLLRSPPFDPVMLGMRVLFVSSDHHVSDQLVVASLSHNPTPVLLSSALSLPCYVPALPCPLCVVMSSHWRRQSRTRLSECALQILSSAQTWIILNLMLYRRAFLNWLFALNSHGKLDSGISLLILRVSMGKS